jgi:pimeloyl-ACP methyl ester carboxylesterase
MALSAKRPPAAISLQSTFTSVPDVMRRTLAALIVPPLNYLFLKSHYNTLDTLRKLLQTEQQVAVFVAHGEKDSLIPCSMGRAIATMAGAHLAPQLHEFYVDPQAGHNDFPTEPALYWQRIDRWLKRSSITS